MGFKLLNFLSIGFYK